MVEPKFYTSEKLDTNSDIGLKSAAVLSFSGNTDDSMVKELTQNALDARQEQNGKLEISIRAFEIDKSEIPHFDFFEQQWVSMKDYYDNQNDGRQYKEFFKRAASTLGNDKLKVLVYEDFETKGLEGDDSNGTFKTCVNSENMSKKHKSSSLGRFGIGKNSVFGYSRLQTVFYSSLNTNGEYKFKGVTKGGTYLDKDGVFRDNRIYYGNHIESADGRHAVKLIDEVDAVPLQFQRTRPGLSQFVLGVDLDEGWQENIKRAFIQNYWFLFESDKLKVNVNGSDIDSSNFIEEANKLFKDDTSEGNPLSYIKAFREGAHETKVIDKIGEVELHLLEANEDESFPNKVMFLRDGMKVYLERLGVGGLPSSIAGVMYCNNDPGNTILGAMEPPTHDKFEANRVADEDVSITVSQATKVLSDLRKFRINEIRKIKAKYGAEVESIDLVDDLFSSLLGGVKGGTGVGRTDETEDESFYRKNLNLDLKGDFSSYGKNAIVNLGDADVEDGDGPESGHGKGGKGNLKGKKKRKKKGDGGGGVVKPGPRSTKNKLSLSGRFFVDSASAESNKYKMIIKSSDAIDSCNIVIGQHGDSRNGVGTMGAELISVNKGALEFESVVTTDGIVTGYEIKNISVDGSESFELEFKEATQSAFKIIESK